MKQKITFKPGTMLNPVPAVMVSCGSSEEEHNIITAAWTGIINSQPPMTYVSIRPSRHSHGIIQKNGEFVINLTTEELARKTDWCGVKSGRDENKFEAMELTKMACDHLACPMIAEAPVNLECRVVEVKSYGSHDMFIAEILGVHVDAALMDEQQRLCLERAHLIAYCHGHYYGLQRKPIGRFGFSVMKPKTAKRLRKANQKAKGKTQRAGAERRSKAEKRGTE